MQGARKIRNAFINVNRCAPARDKVPARNAVWLSRARAERAPPIHRLMPQPQAKIRVIHASSAGESIVGDSA
jgi:hypothetical protein